MRLPRNRQTASLRVCAALCVGLLVRPSLCLAVPFCSVFDAEAAAAAAHSGACSPPPDSFLHFPTVSRKAPSVLAPDEGLEVLHELLDGLQVMQDEWYVAWLGTWPTAIDWTAAVIGTHVSGALSTASQALDLLGGAAAGQNAAAEDGTCPLDFRDKENLVDSYFSQVVGAYFGQNAFDIRGQAFDDMLWVVLGWLESIRFVRLHSERHFGNASSSSSSLRGPLPWHGNIWVPAFAHRARVFWDLSSKGWDTSLCGGGMLWNPNLLPYKNAITNELWIAASVGMYLYFPGDNNSSPFTVTAPHQPQPGVGLDYRRGLERGGGEDGPLGRGKGSSGDPNEPDCPPPHQTPHDPVFLEAALEAYRWLQASNMTNSQGLYTDGFHISGLHHTNNTRCDERAEQVYTYNQAVLLSGQRGLWLATGDPTFLADGHRLVQAAVAATGWDLETDAVAAEAAAKNGRARDAGSRVPGGKAKEKPSTLPPYMGLGRAGVLEEVCDAPGDCSQDSQTFKGIFFHHLAAFCAPLESPGSPPPPSIVQNTRDGKKQQPKLNKAAVAAVTSAHAAACAAYAGWVGHNARAALLARDAGSGKFGMWWNAGLVTNDSYAGSSWEAEVLARRRSGRGGASASEADRAWWDYRSLGLPPTRQAGRDTWIETGEDVEGQEGSPPPTPLLRQGPEQQAVLGQQAKKGSRGGEREKRLASRDHADPNERGRGRTVETQSGGLAVLRAWWSIAHGL